MLRGEQSGRDATDIIRGLREETARRRIEEYAEKARIPDLTEWKGHIDTSDIDASDAKKEIEKYKSSNTEGVALMRLLAERYAKMLDPDAEGEIMPLHDITRNNPKGQGVIIGMPNGMSFVIRVRTAGSGRPENIARIITQETQNLEEPLLVDYFHNPQSGERGHAHSVPHAVAVLSKEQVGKLISSLENLDHPDPTIMAEVAHRIDAQFGETEERISNKITKNQENGKPAHESDIEHLQKIQYIQGATGWVSDELNRERAELVSA